MYNYMYYANLVKTPGYGTSIIYRNDLHVFHVKAHPSDRIISFCLNNINSCNTYGNSKINTGGKDKTLFTYCAT